MRDPRTWKLGSRKCVRSHAQWLKRKISKKLTNPRQACYGCAKLVLERRGEYKAKEYQVRHGVVDELGVRMFVELPKLPAALDVKFVRTTAFPY